MKKFRLLTTIFVAVFLFSSCSNMLESLDKAAEPKSPEKPKVVSYTVEHWQQNIENDEYTKLVKDTQTLSGKIGEETKATAKTYTGFTAKALEQKTLSAAETSVIKIFYDRKITALTLNPNGGKFYNGSTEPETFNRKYGSTFTIGMGEVFWPSREGYEFRGWAYKSDATNCNFAQELNFEVTDATPSSVTLYAIWKSSLYTSNVYLTVKGQPWNNSGCELKAVKDGKEYTLQTSQNTNAYSANLLEGIYDIYIDSFDTGMDLTVSESGTQNVTIDYEAPVRYATSETIESVVSSINGEIKIIILGELDNNSLITIRNAINNSNHDIKLDLSRTTGLTELQKGIFYFCEKLIEIEIPNSVTSIGDNAFEGAGLKYITLPNAVTSIGKEMFAQCFELKKIEIPNSVTSIGNNAFYGCKSLESIEIPNSVAAIGEFAFFNCESFESIAIPNSVTSIGEAAFGSCANLKSIEIPNSITSIEDSTFGGCKNLKSIQIPNSVTSIGNWAFLGCKSLTSIAIPDTVTSIGKVVFAGCENLTSITIPDSVTSIGDEAFVECTNLTSIEIPSSITSINNYAFRLCKNLKTINYFGTETQWNAINKGNNWNEGCPSDMVINFNCVKATAANINKVISGLTADATIVMSGDVTNDDINTIKNAIKTSNFNINLDLSEDSELTSLSENAFYGCHKLQRIEIPNSVTSIGNFAFYECTSLESIEIPNFVTSIGNSSFRECANLESIEIPNSVTTIGGYAFSGCTSLKSVEIPNSVTSLGMWAFSGSTSLESIEIPNSVTSIGACAFWECTSLESIKLPNSVTSIGNSIFRGCTSLESVEIPNSVTFIDYCAFWECTSLESIEIPNSVTSIGDQAFYECTSLGNIEISNSVTSIGACAFYGCTSLESIEIPNSVTSIGEQVFSGCASLESIEIPNSVTSISDFAFLRCTSLENIEIPNSVTAIGIYAFSGCTGLKSIEIPSSVTSIGEYAFRECTSLQTINYTGPEDRWNNIIKGTNWNYNCPANMVINYNYQE